MTFHCKFGFWEQLLRMFQYWAQPQFFSINTSWTQISHVLDNNYIINKHCKKAWPVSKYVKIGEGKKTSRQFPLSSLTPPQSGTFPTTSRQVNSLALRWGYHLSLLNSAGWSGWNFAWKYPTWCKKNMEKGISTNSIPCSLLVDVSGGVASFAKSTDQTAKDNKTELILIVTKWHKTSFPVGCETWLHDESVGEKINQYGRDGRATLVPINSMQAVLGEMTCIKVCYSSKVTR